eukprot:scaffold43382_cov33-Prasinocladus_malaysianus.AAC.2
MEAPCEIIGALSHILIISGMRNRSQVAQLDKSGAFYPGFETERGSQEVVVSSLGRPKYAGVSNSQALTGHLAQA